MNMFRNLGSVERIFVAGAITGAVELAWAALLWRWLGASDAALWWFLTGQLVGLVAYAGTIALLPDPIPEEGEAG